MHVEFIDEEGMQPERAGAVSAVSGGQWRTVGDMGLRFRKSISLGSLLRLNLSKSGVSVGAGPRGLNVNIGPRGVRRTVGLPGTGLYYQDITGWSKSSQAASAAPANSGGESSLGSGLNILGLVIAVIVIAVYFGGGLPSTAPNDSGASAAKVEPPPALPAVVAPKPDRPLNRDEVRELQTLLRRQGFDAGAPDGIIGPKTRAAAQAFARAHRLAAPVEPTLRVLEDARGRRK